VFIHSWVLDVHFVNGSEETIRTDGIGVDVAPHTSCDEILVRRKSNDDAVG